LFIDATHPEYNAQAVYGWMKRGERQTLKTNSGRQCWTYTAPSMQKPMK